jgi:hypothetical protein
LVELDKKTASPLIRSFSILAGIYAHLEKTPPIGICNLSDSYYHAPARRATAEMLCGGGSMCRVIIYSALAAL